MNQIVTQETAEIIDAEPVQNHQAPVDPMINMIERVVMSPDADLEKLERMLAMKTQMEEREARRAFDQAIAAAKAEIPPILKTGTVDYRNNKGERTYFRHETLDGIAKVVDPILSGYGLSYRFRSVQKEGAVHVTCVVAHRDGHSEETTLQGAPDTSGAKNNYQAVGSAVTYLQRYTLKLALGLSAAQDDDANGASSQETISAEQFIKLRDMIETIGIEEDLFLKTECLTSLESAPADRFDAIVGNLTQAAKARGVEL